MSNVLQFIGSFHQGGSERQAVQLTRLLHEDKTHQIFAATLNKEGVLLDEAEKIGLPAIPEFKLASFYDANFIRQLKNCARFIKENKIEIVHTHDFYTNVFGISAARLANVKLKIASKRETEGVRSGSQKFIEKQIFKLADKVVVNAEAVKKYLISQNVNERKIDVIYNGLDLERLTPKTADHPTIRQNFKLPVEENIKFVTLVANLRHEVKNQRMFLRTAERVGKIYPNAHFVLAGEGELRGEMELAAREMNIADRVHFTGRCEKVPELLKISEICVLTSFYEGFSNSILEYMAAGKPVVATNVGGASEAIIEGRTGFLVESNDDEKMANCLIEFLQNAEKAAEFGRNGKQTVVEKFSTQSQLRNVLALYKSF